MDMVHVADFLISIVRWYFPICYPPHERYLTCCSVGSTQSDGRPHQLYPYQASKISQVQIGYLSCRWTKADFTVCLLGSIGYILGHVLEGDQSAGVCGNFTTLKVRIHPLPSHWLLTKLTWMVPLNHVGMSARRVKKNGHGACGWFLDLYCTLVLSCLLSPTWKVSNLLHCREYAVWWQATSALPIPGLRNLPSTFWLLLV